MTTESPRRVEIAFLVSGRNGVPSWKRTTTTAARVSATCEKLAAKHDVIEFRFADVCA